MLRYKADRRTLGFVASYYLLLVFLWVWTPSQWWITVPLVMGLAAISWICAVITHNTIHCPVFKNKTANKAFQVVLTLSYGHPVSSYVSGHNLSHHKYTQEARDIMRTTKVRYRWNLLNGLLFFPTVGGAIMKHDFMFARAMRKRMPKWARQFYIELVIFAAVSVTLLVLDWQKFLFFWFLPHTWAAWGITTINYLQHDGCDPDHPYNHSRNFVGKFFGWWTFNNGFHTIHHKTPGLHWSLLPEAHAREIVPHMDPRLDEPSIAKYIWRTFFWPAKRVRYDGEPVVLPDAVPDDSSWIPSQKESLEGFSLGAEA